MHAAVVSRADVGGHPQIDGGHAWEATYEIVRELLESIADGARGRGQLEGEAHPASLADGEVLDHAKADDVATEVRVLDGRQDGEDLFLTGH